MPKKIAEDHNTFRGILTEANKKYLKNALQSGSVFSQRKVAITIPKMAMPSFTFNGSEYSMDQETPKKKKKPKLYRSITDPFEPAW